MSTEWVKVADRAQSVFAAVSFSLGLDHEEFRGATGWDVGVEYHRYEAGVHWLSAEDHQRLSDVVAGQASANPRFWAGYLDRATLRGDRLLSTARSVAAVADTAPPPTLPQGLAALSEAMRHMAPFTVATPAVQAVLDVQLTRLIDTEAPAASLLRQRSPELVLRLLRGWAHPEAVREMRDCYGIGLALASIAEAVDLRNTSPALAARRLAAEFAELWARIEEHGREYAWLWARGRPGAGRSPVEIVERMQGALVRWPADLVGEIAARNPVADPGTVLGFAPSDELAELLRAYRQLTSAVAFRLDALAKAEGIASPFFARVAELLGCSGEQLTGSTPAEIHAALAGAAPLPAAEIERRIGEGFVVDGAGDDLRVRAGGGKREPGAGALNGVSASRGLAVGPVKIIEGGSQIGRLAPGDILVTATSSPDVLADTSMFPSRTGLAGIGMAAAVVTDEGGTLSHAGIVSREHGIPCVVGTGAATGALVDGQVVEVDARRPKGLVTVLG